MSLQLFANLNLIELYNLDAPRVRVSDMFPRQTGLESAVRTSL